MDSFFKSFNQYKSFRLNIEDEKKFDLTIMIDNKKVSSPFKALQLNLSTIVIASERPIPIGKDLDLILSCKKWPSNWETEVLGKVIQNFYSESEILPYRIKISFSKTLELKYLLKDYLHRTSKKKLYQQFLQSSLSTSFEKQETSSESFGLILDLIKKYFRENSNKQKITREAGEIKRLLSADHIKIFSYDNREQRLNKIICDHDPEQENTNISLYSRVITKKEIVNIYKEKEAYLISPILSQDKTPIGLIEVSKINSEKRFNLSEEKILQSLKDLLQLPILKGEKVSLKKMIYLGNSDFAHNQNDLIHSLKEKTENILISGQRGTGKKFVSNFLIPPEQTYIIDCSKENDFTYFPEENKTIILRNIELLKVENQKEVLRHLKMFKVQVITITTSNLYQLVSNGMFNKELYFILSKNIIDLPPINHNPKDLLFAATFFLHLEIQSRNLKNISFTEETLSDIQSYYWSGGMKELKDKIKKSFLKNDYKNNVFIHLENLKQGHHDFLVKSISNNKLSTKDHIKILKEAI